MSESMCSWEEGGEHEGGVRACAVRRRDEWEHVQLRRDLSRKGEWSKHVHLGGCRGGNICSSVDVQGAFCVITICQRYAKAFCRVV